MPARTAAEVLAGVTGSVVRHADVHDVLNRLLHDSLELLEAEATGVMVVPLEGRLELLGATSHQAAQLELFSIQSESGPCHDAINGDRAVVCDSREKIESGWDEVGRAIVAAGYGSMMALPVRWRGRVLGGLNVFRAKEDLPGEAAVLGQTIADVISLVLVHAVAVNSDDVAVNLRRVIVGRAVIERAKGALAQQRGVDLAEAHDVLLESSRTRDLSLTAAAEDVLRAAQRRD